MKQIAPDYYEKFKCIAGDCKHNCCIGWEIDIDEFTLDYYNSVEGEMGERFKKYISREGDAPHFCLSDNERCPFLNEKNLCDIISALGEDALCDICADHPRFRNYFSDREEIGLGLCCESAGQLILGNKEKTNLVCIYDDGEKESLTTEEELVLKLREALFSIVQNREKTVDERIKDAFEFFSIKPKERKITEWAEIFLSMERLDEKWTELLLKMKNAPELTDALTFENEFETVFEQLLWYFIYRQFSLSAEDGRLKERIIFALESCLFIMKICAFHKKSYGSISLDDIVEYSRLYSSEMEYSSENVGKYLKVTAVETHKV
ncbi:MAG: flagellin lysine-N-methylase [Clostridia bacterium]|nr:flagellin lysine-N-methylase [Clostridia bacterium]